MHLLCIVHSFIPVSFTQTNVYWLLSVRHLTWSAWRHSSLPGTWFISRRVSQLLLELRHLWNEGNGHHALSSLFRFSCSESLFSLGIFILYSSPKTQSLPGDLSLFIKLWNICEYTHTQTHVSTCIHIYMYTDYNLFAKIPPFNFCITHSLRVIEGRHYAICGGIDTQIGMLKSPCPLNRYNLKKRRNIFTNYNMSESYP